MRAMILAAGRGKRLRPITDGCPKPLIKVNQKPLIQYHIEALARAGITDIVINVCHLADQITQTLKDGKQFGVNIQYSDESGQLLETAGGIKKALTLLGDEPFIVVNGDIYTEYPFAKLQAPQKEAHLILVPNPPHVPQGDFSLEAGMIGQRQQGSSSYTFSGIACYKPSFFDTCQSTVMPLAPLYHQSILREGLTGEVYQGFWTDVGDMERLDALQTILATKSLNQTG